MFFPPLISCLLRHVSSAAGFIGDEKFSNRIWLLSTSISQSFSIKKSHTWDKGDERGIRASREIKFAARPLESWRL
ncbi:hypothetical protein BRARA_I02337 [Brassica rapa]|uniref:Secreted protein n=1 Tax=Brassica campestris TaxID=3711 RepID=A0A397XXD2_BRACM|nr:hypothetical protein BRARA_I02337 [Brassica rapa]